MYNKINEGIMFEHIDAVQVEVKNKIGCGDIFGAVFFYSYLCGKNLSESLSLANKLAGITVANNILENPEILNKYA